MPSLPRASYSKRRDSRSSQSDDKENLGVNKNKQWRHSDFVLCRRNNNKTIIWTSSCSSSGNGQGHVEPLVLQRPKLFSLDEAIANLVVPPKPKSSIPSVNFLGLVNLGNTCYMNCIVQVLVHMKPIQDIFLRFEPIRRESLGSKTPKKRKRRTSFENLVTDPDQEGPLMKAFKNLLFEFLDVDRCRPCIAPNNFVHSVWEKIEHIANGRQQDAHEFFISFLNVLHVELLQWWKSPAEGVNTRKMTAEIQKTSGSPIDMIFLGRMQSEVTCVVCRHSRIIIDPFWDASLEVVGEQDQTTSKGKKGGGGSGSGSDVVLQLTDLLKRFTQVEHLETAMLLCPCCAKRTQSTKQLSFKSLPPVICLHLKRFQHCRSYSPRKIKTKVSIPEFLDFTPFKSDAVSDTCSSSSDANQTTRMEFECCNMRNMENWYTLFAVVNHLGTYAGGHYHSYIKKSSFWFKCDDSKISEVSRDEVLNSEGYLLFYKKTDPGFSIFD